MSNGTSCAGMSGDDQRENNYTGNTEHADVSSGGMEIQGRLKHTTVQMRSTTRGVSQRRSGADLKWER